MSIYNHEISKADLPSPSNWQKFFLTKKNIYQKNKELILTIQLEQKYSKTKYKFIFKSSVGGMLMAFKAAKTFLIKRKRHGYKRISFIGKRAQTHLLFALGTHTKNSLTERLYFRTNE